MRLKVCLWLCSLSLFLPSAGVVSAQNVPATPPAPFVTGDDLIPWYWTFVEVSLRAYAGRQADEAAIQQAMTKMRSEVTVQSCAQTDDEWFDDLGVYYVTWGCRLAGKTPKPGIQPDTREDNAELFLIRQDGKWVTAGEGDALACAVARRENSERTWASYNKHYPEGQCATQATKETIKPLQAVATLDLFKTYAFNPEGSRLYTFGNGALRIYNVEDGTLVKQLSLKDANVRAGPNALRVSGNGRHVLLGSGKQAWLVDVTAATTRALPFRDPKNSGIDTFELAFDDEAGHAVLLYQDIWSTTYLDRFDVTTGKRVKQFDDGRYINAIGLSRDGRKAVVIGRERTGKERQTAVAIHNTRDGKKLLEYPIAKPAGSPAATFTDNGHYVFYDTDDGVAVRNASTGQRAFKDRQKWLERFDADETRINDKGTLLLETDKLTKSVYLFDIETGKRLYVFNKPATSHAIGNWPTAAFSPDNRHFVVYFEGKGTLVRLNPAGIARVLNAAR